MKILGICGSLRKGSFNGMLLNQALSLAEQAGWETERVDLGAIPLYNADIDGDEKPAVVTQLKDEIQTADAVLIATPEYNYSIPGVLKNALDWASRPAFQSVLKDKPVAILSASVSIVGGARGQVHLRDVLAATLSRVFPAPDYLLPAVGNAFSQDNKLKEDALATILKDYMANYLAWVPARGT